MDQREYPQGKDQWRDLSVTLSEDRLDIGNFQVMQSWERPLMLAMAERVMIDCPREGEILEVGFGMAISANMIIEQQPAGYTVIEAHPEIAENARRWGEKQSVPVTVHQGFFQDVAPALEERFDGILFDPYPITEDEWFNYHLEFMPIAKRLLRPGGTFVYFAGQTTRFSEVHSHAMLELFESTSCLSHRLAGYFGDDRAPAHCGHCSVCHGQVAKLAYSSVVAMPNDDLLKGYLTEVTSLLMTKSDQVLSAEILTRFLTGLMVPLFSRTKVKQLPGFACCQRIRFQEVKEKVIALQTA